MKEPIGTCVECLEPIKDKADIVRHARRHMVGTDHLLREKKS